MNATLGSPTSNQLLSRPKPRRVAVPPQIQVLKSTPDVSPGGSEAKRVVIDGVIFQFEEGGKKLTRIGGGSRTTG